MIRHSIFKKMLAIFLAVSIASMVILGVIAGVLILRSEGERNQQYLEDKLESLRTLSESVNSGDITLAQFRTQMNTLAKAQGFAAFLIPLDTGKARLAQLRERLANQQSFGRLPESVKESILSGEDVTYRNTAGGSTTILIAGPVVKGENKDYSVILVRRSQDGQAGQGYLVWILIAAFAVLTAVAITVLAAAARKYTKPLVQISRVCEAVAAGDYSRRVNVAANDETGVIADSMNRMVGRLAYLNEAKSEFVANISHELRTPLTIIRANLQGIKDGIIEPGEQSAYFESTLAETRRMERLVNELIDISNIESSTFAIEPEEKDFAATAEEAVKLARIPCKRKGITLLSDIASFPASCDHRRITQVLSNILENAIRHTPREGFIRVASWTARGQATVEVENSGSSIPGDTRRVFEKNYKGEGSSGSGLGLYLCKAIIEAHGGGIKAENTAEGVKFSFRIPI